MHDRTLPPSLTLNDGVQARSSDPHFLRFDPRSTSARRAKTDVVPEDGDAGYGAVRGDGGVESEAAFEDCEREGRVDGEVPVADLVSSSVTLKKENGSEEGAHAVGTTADGFATGARNDVRGCGGVCCGELVSSGRTGRGSRKRTGSIHSALCHVCLDEDGLPANGLNGGVLDTDEGLGACERDQSRADPTSKKATHLVR